MPRKKITSTKQKKAEVQLKRAIKRGDVAPPDASAKKPNRKKRPGRVGPTGRILGAAGDSNKGVVESARKLQSAFVKLPVKFLEDSKHVASTIPLPRPILPETAVFNDRIYAKPDDWIDADHQQFTCPKRPKWRFDMTKEEVEKNEEGLFTRWLIEMDNIVESWKNSPKVKPKSEETETAEEKGESEVKEVLEMPRSPTYFERNIEVWRQLWRVAEISQIILVLLDSRCPLLHYPPSLSTYLADRKVILVLTKVDIAGPSRADAWVSYLRTQYPGLQIVQVESYIEKEVSSDQQGRKMYQPHLPEGFRERLVDAIKKVHEELLEPPERIRDNEQKLKNWKPRVKKDINWDAVLKAKGGQVGSAVGGAAMPKQKDGHGGVGNDSSSNDDEDNGEPEFLTVGLIGQPNVGKSSLLNALFGSIKVRASRTPGKTKHFQTLFWTPDVRLVDCPGLVMPNFVPMEMQVLAGVLPISRVSAVPSCIHYAGIYLPLEHVFKLVHPVLTSPPVEDKRTWREGTRPSKKEPGMMWTAMDILTAYADAKGWVTAKAGRPDVNRAGNAILRALAEGKVGWAFWPPGIDIHTFQPDGDHGEGIWISNQTRLDEGADFESDEEVGLESPSGSEDHGEESGEEDEDEEEETLGEVQPLHGQGMFGALALADDDDESE